MHDLLRCVFFTALSTLVTSGSELHSNDELGRLGDRLGDDALMFALKPIYIKGRPSQTFCSFGIKLPGHVMTACALISKVKVKLSQSMFSRF